MNLVFFLKVLTDLCYYAIFAAFFASFYGLTGSILPQLAWIALSAALCRMAFHRFSAPSLRFLPLLLSVPAFWIPNSAAGLVILCPALLYAGFCVCTRRWDPSYYEATDQFQLALKILPIPAALAAVLLQLERIEQFSLPYLLVFLLGSVLLLRMLRHDEETLRQPRFRLMNGLSMAALCMVCLGISSPFFRQCVGFVLKSVWKVVSLPILLVTVVVGGGLALLFDAVIPDDFHFDPVQLEGFMQPMENGEEQQKLQEMMGEVEPDPTVAYVFSAIGILIAIVLIVLLFRWLAAKRRTRSVMHSNEMRFSAAPLAPGEKPLTRLSARTPAMQVRYWYQQLLRRTRQEGGTLTPSMNTRQQENVGTSVFKDHAALHRLRQLYLPARYADRATEQDAHEAKALYQQLKK